MIEMMVQLISTRGGGHEVLQTNWISGEAMWEIQKKADEIAEAAPAWLGADTITIGQFGRENKRRALDTHWPLR